MFGLKNKICAFAKKLKNNEKGVYIVEYALAFPILMTMTFGALEMGRILMVYSALEGAVTESTRVSITGFLPEEYSNLSIPESQKHMKYISDFVEDSLTQYGISGGVDISMKVYSSFADIGEEEPFTDDGSGDPNFAGNNVCDAGESFTDINGNGVWDEDMGTSGTGGEENIMLMTISVSLPYLAPGVVEAFGGETHMDLSTSTAVRNEPFGGNTWVPGTATLNCGI